MKTLGRREIRVGIFNDTATNGHFGCVSVMNAIRCFAMTNGFRPVFSWPVNWDWRLSKDWIRDRRLDAIVVNGEGSIHHTRSRSKALFLCEIASFARNELGIPAFLINATLDELCPSAIDHLRNFAGIYLRETRSQEILQQASLQSNVVPDLSFFAPALRGVTEISAGGVIVTDSVFPEVSELLRSFAKDKNYIYRPMQGKDAFFLPVRHKRRLQRKLTPELFRLSRLRSGVDLLLTKRFYSRLASSSGVVTGRFHSCTLATRARKPILAVESNTPKISAMLTDILGKDQAALRVMDPGNFGSSAAFQAPEPYSSAELAMIDEYLETGLKRAQEMFSAIRRSAA